MHIDILTIFPEMFAGPFSSSIIKRAIDCGLVSISLHNIRDYTHDKHHTVDDYPYGGGAGMVMKPEPIFEAVESIKDSNSSGSEQSDWPVILLSPRGRLFSQAIALELSRFSRLMLICGHYEGVDERVSEHVVMDEISIGDYVLSGGELAAMVVVDAALRLVPGVLGSEFSVIEDSHTAGLLEYPQFTRPAEFRGWEVPEVLLSGDHAEVVRWRREQSLRRTLKRRPDMIEKANLTAEERQWVTNLK